MANRGLGHASTALHPAGFALRPAALDVGRYERFAQFLAERQLIKSPPDVETYAVDLGR